ncbi:MAG TPA: hypothetical protein VGQ59_02945 [Cyclobacteriaceae bacterium]|jgi:hypothetical protein|nr:hypothetical protein [Cyclobacteriaceae bacterium]
MKTLVRILCQYFENYSTSGDGQPYWKPKGGVEFTLRADSDIFTYDEDFAIRAIKSLLETKSNPKARYEYFSHELVFHEPIELNADEFMSSYSKISSEKPRHSLQP